MLCRQCKTNWPTITWRPNQGVSATWVLAATTPIGWPMVEVLRIGVPLGFDLEDRCPGFVFGSISER